MTLSETPPPISDPRQYAINFYTNKGLTEPQARGIVRWMYNKESGLDPAAYNPTGGGQGALGAAQWRGSRQAALLRRPDAHTLPGQLEFSWEELNTTERQSLDAIKRSKTESEAFDAFGRHFERGGPSQSLGGGYSSLLSSIDSYSPMMKASDYFMGGPSFTAPEEPSLARKSSLPASTEPDQSTLKPAVQSVPSEAEPVTLAPAVIRRPIMPQFGALSSAYQKALASILQRL